MTAISDAGPDDGPSLHGLGGVRSEEPRTAGLLLLFAAAVALPLPTALPIQPLQRAIASALVVWAGVIVVRRLRAVPALAALLALAVVLALPVAGDAGEVVRTGLASLVLVLAGRRRGGAPAWIGQALAATAIWLFVADRVRFGHLVAESAASALTSVYSAAGLHATAVSFDYVDWSFAVFCALLLACRSPARPLRIALSIAAGLGIFLGEHVLVSLAGWIADEVPSLWVSLAVRVSVLPGLALAASRRAQESSRPVAERTSARMGWALPAVVLAGTALPLLVPQQTTRSGALDVLVLDRGLSEWSRADFGQFGDFSLGMFGEMDRYLAADDVRIRRGFRDEPLTADALAAADVLVLINDGDPWKPGEAGLVQDRLRSGGGVLVLCDHTDVVGQMAVVNEITAPHGIQLQFDSAIGHGAPAWNRALSAYPSAATCGVESFHHAVGASLRLTPPALPILRGRYSLSDAGIRENVMGAQLGNYTWDPGERRGGLVLAAEAAVGDGRLVVLGDTTTFQNACLSDYWGFTRRILRHAAGGPSRSEVPAALALTAAAGFLSLLVVLGAPTGAKLASWGGASVVAFAACVQGVTPAEYGDVAPRSIDGGPGSVLVDTTVHRDAPSHETTYKVRGDGQFIATVARNDGIPYRGHFARIPVRARLTVVDNPAWIYPAAGQEALLDDVRAGGNLLLVAGYESAPHVAFLLDACGLRVSSQTPGNRQEGEGIWYGRAVGVPRFVEPWILEGGRDCDVLATIGGAPVIVRCRVGEGSVTVVSDPRFLENSNLDIATGGRAANQFLVAEILRRCGVETRPREPAR